MDGVGMEAMMTAAALDAVWRRLGDTGSRLILHGGPVLGSATARRVAGKAAATVLVAHWSDLEGDAVAEAAAVIREAGGRVAGVVLMEADPAALPGLDLEKGREMWPDERRDRRWGAAAPSPFATTRGL